jgi:uncharacterized membrane protein
LKAVDLEKQLLSFQALERSSVLSIKNIKIGVVLCKPGQTTEEQMLSNGKFDFVSSRAFFISILNSLENTILNLKTFSFRAFHK